MKHLLSLLIPKTDAATFAMMIKDSLIRFLLPLSQCQGQSYDGVSNISGHIIIWSCCQYTKGGRISHLCPLFGTLYKFCLQTIGNQLVPIRDALFLVQEINQLIHFLSKGSSLFEDMQADLSPGAPKLNHCVQRDGQCALTPLMQC